MRTKKFQTPKLPTKLLSWYCPPELAEDLLGDLEENYLNNIKAMSPFRAKLKYWMQSLSLLFSYALRSRKSKTSRRNSSFNVALLMNHGKIAVRNLSRQKTFSIINIVCLAVGMSVGLLALAVFIDFKEVDNFHLKRENIYRVITHVDDKHSKDTYASSSAPLAYRLMQEGEGIEEVVQFKRSAFGEIELAENSTVPISGYYASENFFTVFDFKLEKGNPANALTKPFSMVITQEAAKKLFGDRDPLGSILSVKDLGDFEITGVMKEHPRTHFLFETLISFNTLEALESQGHESELRDWGPRTKFYTYMLLSPGKSADDVETGLNSIAADYFENKSDLDVTIGLQSLRDIPARDYTNEIGLSWGDASLLIFFALALLVLLPACLNYSNISIARALRRAKEIGLRKVSGGQTHNIFLQMIMETVILSLVALGGGIFIFMLAREEFLSMVVWGRRMFDLEITPFTLLVFVLFAIGTGILAGIFPASYFSKLNPIETLRNASLSGKLSKVNVRKGLIVFQFVLSLVFILGVVIIVRQYRYALNYDMGFQKNNILEVPLKGANYELLKAMMDKIPDVRNVSMASSIPGSWETSQAWVQSSGETDSMKVNQLFVDENFLSCLEIPLLGGKNFPEKTTHDESYIIVNETFLSDFKITSVTEALDKTFIVDHEKTLRVIGVVKDFNHMPLREQISSFFFRYDPKKFAVANVRIGTQDIGTTLSQIEEAWTQIAPGQPFEAYFLDDKLEESLVSFRNMIKIFGFLGGLAITISCLGLLAVVISTSESRIKEMGLRKVMGATPGNLALVLSRGFIKLIVIAIMIATPFTYFLFEKLFLRMQFYRASVGWIDLSIGIVALVLLLIVTIGGQTLKVARVNPVETLKCE